MNFIANADATLRSLLEFITKDAYMQESALVKHLKGVEKIIDFNDSKYESKI